MTKMNWSLSNLPPVGHKDVADFAYALFDIARIEKERLGKPGDFLANFAIYKGFSSNPKSSPTLSKKNPVNLYFANIERTVSNITSRVPTGEVIDMDGLHDNVENILSMQLKKWWKDTDQQPKTKITARSMEVYGVTVEKPIRDPIKNSPDILVTDPFAFFPAPGFWRDLSTEAPYVCFIYADYVNNIESVFDITDISQEDSYELLGQSRELFKQNNPNMRHRMGNYSDPMTISSKVNQPVSDKLVEKGVIIEVWVRDKQIVSEEIEEPLIDDDGNTVLDEFGEPITQSVITKRQLCPDGVRKITISKSKSIGNRLGWVVLDDTPNPNINYRHLAAGPDVSNTYPWGRFPVYKANSYSDEISIWGFAASEQVGDLIEKINQIVTKLIAYVINVMTPPLIVQQHCGITKDMIESSLKKDGRLILMPSTPNARIEFMPIPDLPSTFFQVLNLIVGFFDRIYQIEDADRGVVPSGVIAASAIIALQERNQVLMQAKTSAIDYLVEQRSKWAIGLWQNWGTEEESVDINGEQTIFRAVNYVNRKFNFVVESGSTTPRTSLQLQDMAKWLYEVKAISQKGLLEAVNWPNWKEEVERTAESQMDQALRILIDSGLPEESAIALKNMLLQVSLQDEPGNTPGGHQPAQPKSKMPPSSNVQSGS